MSHGNKLLLHRWCDEGFNKGYIDLADELYDADVVYFEPAAGHVTGVTALKEFVKSWRSAFPDARLRVEEQIAEADRVATRWTFLGTHSGTFRGIAATGRRVKMDAMYFYRIANGKIVEINAMVDTFGLMQQIGDLQPNVKAEVS